MIGPYQMVFINFIGCLLVFGVAFFYRYIFPKRKINLFIFLLIISFLPLVSLLRAGVYESGDFNLHIYRAIAFYQNLVDGNLLPSWAGKLNATYGYPLFVFLNPLPYYLISFFHFLNFSFIASMKIFIALAYILSGLFMYLLAKETLKNDLAAFTSSIFYLFMPYHFVDLHFRIDVGEILCFTLIPLLLFFTYRLFKRGAIVYIFWTALSFALLIMSHQAIALLALFPIVAFLLIQFLQNQERIRQIRLWMKLAAAFLLGILISSYVWLPYLIFAKYNLSSTLFNALPSFISVRELLYSPWRYGLLFQGPKGELSYLIGYAQLFILGYLLVYLLLKKTKARYAMEVTIWLATTAFLIFMLTPYSSIIWLNTPMLKNVLMSSRILSVITLGISFAAGYFALINRNRKVIVWLVIGLAISSTILNWGNRRVIPQITDTQLINNLPLSTYQGEGLNYIANSIWFSNQPVWINKIPDSKIDTLKGQAEIKVLSITSTKHFYSVNSTGDAVLKENTLYYPGWTVSVNGKQTEINFTNKRYPGIITFTIPKGKTQIMVAYKDPPILQILKSGFILALIAILSYTIFVFCKNPTLIAKLKKARKRFA
ncbi:MAG: 6-pyruvoyl-tetrahydropterin synthase-related protein [Candidatus Levyibacteriota bacterium]